MRRTPLTTTRHAGPGGRHAAPGALPLGAADRRPVPGGVRPPRAGDEGAGPGRLPRRPLPPALPHPRHAQVVSVAARFRGAATASGWLPVDFYGFAISGSECNACPTTFKQFINRVK